MSFREAAKIRPVSTVDALVFSQDERQEASFIGQLGRAANGEEWVGSITLQGGGTILLHGRRSNGKLVLRAKHGMTADEKRLRREQD